MIPWRFPDLKHALIFVCVLAGTLASFAIPSHAQTERILSFDSRVVILPSGTLEVTETITVRADGKQIRRGIYRDFPTQRGRYWYGPHRIAFDVLSVKRDGQPETWRREDKTYAARLYIGDANRLLRPGTYTYEITYRTDRQIGFLPDREELSWNVTGNFWVFPIDKASVTVVPPGAVNITRATSATGRFGSTDNEAITTLTPDGGATSVTTRSLAAREGLTVTVALPSSSVPTPDFEQTLSNLWRDGAPVWMGLVGLLLVVGYYSAVWAAYGKDPDSGTIIPQYEPPEGVGPAACRYIMNMGWDPKGFTAALVNLAAKGFVKISEFEEDKYKFTRTGQSIKQTKLSPGETVVASALFGDNTWNSFVFRSENHAISDRARKTLRRSLKEDFENVYFVKNKSLLSLGTALSALALAGMVAVSISGAGMGVFALAVSLLSFALYPLLLGIWTGWRRGEGGVINFSVSTAVIVIAAGVVLGDGQGVLLNFLDGVVAAHIGVIVLIVGTNLLFYHLLKAPSRLGRRVMDHIEGFRLYLSVAEKDRLNFHNPPDVTPEVFEKYLPYAIALDVENEWGAQFEHALNRLGTARAASRYEPTASRYEPSWFDSSFHSWPTPTSFARGFTPAFGDSVVSSLAPPSSAASAGSSGISFSGGGFSGGGGGGGGGGGW